jgi:nucleotidyltransferase/DNA polymerase involved in DNA repair
MDLDASLTGNGKFAVKEFLLIIGGGDRGVVACSYEAGAFGVRSAVLSQWL